MFNKINILKLKLYIHTDDNEKALKAIKSINKKKLYVNKYNTVMLQYAYTCKNMVVFKELLNYMHYDKNNYHNNTILFNIVSTEKECDYIKEMLRNSSTPLNLKITNSDGTSLLTLASMNKNIDIMNLLLNNFDRLDLTSHNQYGYTFLHYVFYNNLCSIIPKLLNINVSYINSSINELTLLMLLYKNKKYDVLYAMIVKYMKSIDFKLKDNNGLNILMYISTINNDTYNQLIISILEYNKQLVYEKTI